MRFAVIGTNFISDNFAEAVKDVENAEITAVYSRQKATGVAFADRHGIKQVFNDYEEMLSRGGFDAVYVASPTLLHEKHSVLAMEAGYHVLCEKMMAPTLDDFYSMKSRSENTGKVILEAMRPSFDPAYEFVKEAVLKIGKIRRADLRFCQYSSRYDRFKAGILTNAFDPKMKNSALSDIGIYPLNIAISLFGSPKSISSSSVFLHNGFEGEGTALLEYDDMLATISYSKITEGVIPSIIEGEYGTLIIDKLTAPTKITLSMRGLDKEDIWISSCKNNMKYEIEAFCLMCEGKKPHKDYLDITERTQIIVDKIYKRNGIDYRF